MPIDDALEKIQGSTLKEIDFLEEASFYDLEDILNGKTFYSDEKIVAIITLACLLLLNRH